MEVVNNKWMVREIRVIGARHNLVIKIFAGSIRNRLSFQTFSYHHLLTGPLSRQLHVATRGGDRLAYCIHWVTTTITITVPVCTHFSLAWNINQKWSTVTSICFSFCQQEIKANDNVNYYCDSEKVKSVFLQSTNCTEF